MISTIALTISTISSDRLQYSSKDLEPSNHPTAHDSIVQLFVNLLNPLKPNESARFTLQVIEQTSQGVELLWTASLETVVDLLLVHRRVDMGFQRFPRVEPPFAYVTHPEVAIPGTVSDRVG